ncbi:MAG: QueT transporter family protein [Peptococcaceae bacterium]|nr:QueT transporter family protein [Peptococcaceae bacterium]
MKNLFNTNNIANNIARAGLIAAVYVVITLIIRPIAYGPIQFRLSEALTLLPFIDPMAIVGLTIGVFFANIASPLGLVDILGGSFLTLIAAYMTYKIKNKYLAMLPPIFVNALGVSLYVAPAYGLPYWPTVLYIGFGQTVVIALLGLPVLALYQKAAGAYIKSVHKN